MPYGIAIRAASRRGGAAVNEQDLVAEQAGVDEVVIAAGIGEDRLAAEADPGAGEGGVILGVEDAAADRAWSCWR